MKSPRLFNKVLAILFSLVLLICNSCKYEEEPIQIAKITGQVQKGPFINGTEIQMYGLHSSLDQTGKIYSTVISNNKGSFAINNIELTSHFVSFTASGYYFNEITGAISVAPLTLFAISDIQDLTTVNVNILTHLEKTRVEYLVGKKTNTFQLAKQTAQEEILAIFGFEREGMENSELLDISKNTEDNAILLAISIILQGNRSVGDLTELLANIITDMEQDGILNDATVLPKLRASTLLLDLAAIRTNLESRYAELGITTTVPDFEKYIYLFLGYTGGAPAASTLAATNVTKEGATLNGTANANSLSTTVTFEYGTTTDYGSTITATPGTVTGIAVTNVSAVLTGLNEGSTYHFRIKAVNSMGTTFGEDKSFTTVTTPPPGGLIAYYPFNGNANDESGNGNNGSVNGATLTMDRFGNLDKAYSFDGINDWIDIASLSNMQYKPITYSVWFNLESYSFDYSQVILGRIRCNTDDFGGIFIWHYPLQNFDNELMYFTGGGQFSTGYKPPLNKWIHASFSLDEQGIAKWFIDGNLVKSDAYLLISRLEAMFKIGAATACNGTGSYTFFDGKIDDIRIYNKVLTNSEIHELYHEGGYATSETVSDIEGNTYKTVQIGSQVWMAENLKTQKYNDGTPISLINQNTVEGDPGYLVYGDVTIYGLLYNWYAVSSTTNGGKNVCPVGWHVPTDGEWIQMEDYLSNNGYSYDGTIGGANNLAEIGRNKIAKALSSATLLWVQSVNVGAIGNEDYPEKRNASGFSALPAGLGLSVTGFTGSLNSCAYFWTSTSALTTLSWSRTFINSESENRRSAADKSWEFSVRCVKD